MQVALAGLAAAASGVCRRTGVLSTGRGSLPLGLEARGRAAYTAPLLLSAGCRPGGFPLSPGSDRRVPLLLGGGAQLGSLLREDGAPPLGWTETAHAMYGFHAGSAFGALGSAPAAYACLAPPPSFFRHFSGFFLGCFSQHSSSVWESRL
jgi:hypothetical protein